ncbi:hypothetical protein CQW23_26985 [Capsicum baccatum]|uniref:NB-ARC domain-containing protein n=1 Tax=Capsicum baccatum TaxID=33114 RepID=A0A2G2VQC4_CAPBA|nr:hypothetical protein CQW23_26985 [Capsicum baccatum]
MTPSSSAVSGGGFSAPSIHPSSKLAARAVRTLSAQAGCLQHVLGNGEFPALHDLSIDDCPKLVGKFPENLCSLTELRISRCPELNLETPIQLSILKRFEVDGSRKAGVLFDEAELFASQLDGKKQIEELSICDCNSLTSYPTSILPSGCPKKAFECKGSSLEIVFVNMGIWYPAL